MLSSGEHTDLSSKMENMATDTEMKMQGASCEACGRPATKQVAEQVKIEPYNVPYETGIINYGKTKRQLNLMDQDELNELHMKMDRRFDDLVKKEVEKIKAKGEEPRKPKLANKQMTWALPSHIITFLANAIADINDRRLKLMDWPEFKKKLFEIYDHRVEHAPEMNGAINNSYITLDEHLLLYMC